MRLQLCGLFYIQCRWCYCICPSLNASSASTDPVVGYASHTTSRTSRLRLILTRSTASKPADCAQANSASSTRRGSGVAVCDAIWMPCMPANRRSIYQLAWAMDGPRVLWWHRIHTPWPITKKLAQVITSAAPTAVPNLVQIRPRGASGQMGEI